MYSDVYNTTVNVDGKTVYSRTFYPGACCCGGGMFMNSCFGFGYSGVGFGIGFAAGRALTPVLPNIFNGICSGVCWVGKTIGKGVSGLWNSIFHKKTKTKTEKAE